MTARLLGTNESDILKEKLLSTLKETNGLINEAARRQLHFITYFRKTKVLSVWNLNLKYEQTVFNGE
jgi:hypothetical protein